MKNFKSKKIFSIAKIMDEYNYKESETACKRLNNYSFQRNTSITHNDKYIRISTETSIKGVYYVLFLFSDGMSKVTFEFD